VADDEFVDVRLLFTLVIDKVEQSVHLNVEMRKDVVDAGLDGKIKIRNFTVIVD
jgi:hypothetical protein